jgi:hypothetical protein
MKESYHVLGEGTNMSVTNQMFPDEILPPLPYEQNISAEFPFESNYVEVLGSQMYYIHPENRKIVLDYFKIEFDKFLKKFAEQQ